jgi:hypothetical protein
MPLICDRLRNISFLNKKRLVADDNEAQNSIF